MTKIVNTTYINKMIRNFCNHVTPRSVAHPLSMQFSRQEYWSGEPSPSPGHLPNPGIRPRSPTRQTDSLLSSVGKGISPLAITRVVQGPLSEKPQGHHLLPDDESTPAVPPAFVSEVEAKPISSGMTFTSYIGQQLRAQGFKQLKCPCAVEGLFIQWNVKRTKRVSSS